MNKLDNQVITNVLILHLEICLYYACQLVIERVINLITDRSGKTITDKNIAGVMCNDGTGYRSKGYSSK